MLNQIKSPADLRKLSFEEINQLSSEIRSFLIEQVSKSGGHLGPNLGVVELTIAIHRIFDSPKDVVVFDTGHQSYVHKLLTGRMAGFEKLRNVVVWLDIQIEVRANMMLLKTHMHLPPFLGAMALPKVFH